MSENIITQVSQDRPALARGLRLQLQNQPKMFVGAVYHHQRDDLMSLPESILGLFPNVVLFG